MDLLSTPTRRPDGVWSVAVASGYADELLAALDPAGPFVLIGCGDPGRGWHEALVTIGREAEPSSRRVRNLAFDLLVSPSEAAILGPQLRTEHDGSLNAIQFYAEPSPAFQRRSLQRGGADAMRGQRVLLQIKLPRGGDVAVVLSAEREPLDEFVGRL